MRTIRDTLSSGKSMVITQAITGLGGIGKTQIAIEYTYRFLNEYKLIWWVNSDTPTLLATEFSSLASNFGYTKDTENQEILIKLAMSWLQNNSNWLLIFDNATETSHLSEYIPQKSSGHIIITSRNQNWSEIAQDISLGVFDEKEAVAFLLNRTGQADSEAAKKLAEELGYLPLALEHAAAYIKTKGKSIYTYLELFRTYQLALIKKSSQPLSYNATVATAWEISFDSLAANFPLAISLLTIFSFLYPNDIPIDMIKNGYEFLPQELSEIVSRPLEMDEIIGALLQFSLISITNDSISIHRLVQIVIRERLSKEEKKCWADICFKIISKEFIFMRENTETWKYASRIYPHAQKILTYVNDQEIITNETINLINRIGRFLFEHAQYNEALMLLTDAVAKTKIIASIDQKLIIDLISDIGNFYIILKDAKRAISYLLEALCLEEKRDTARHSLIIMLLSNLGVAYEQLNDFAEALTYHERAYKLVNESLSQSSSEFLLTVANLARTLESRGDFKTARQYFEMILHVKEANEIVGIQNYASILSTYSILLQRSGEYSAARKYIEDALRIDKEIYKENHPNVARDLNNLAYLLKDLNELDKAKSLFLEALRINKEFFGDKHPKVAVNMSNLGMVLHSLNQLDSAIELHENALQINKEFYGENHSLVATNYNNLGTTNFSLGNILVAIKCYKKALQIDRGIYGINHPEISTDLCNIAFAIEEMGKIKAAKQIYMKALDIDLKYDGVNDANISRDYNYLSHINVYLGSKSDALTLKERAISLFEKMYGSNHELIYKEYEDYALMLDSFGEEMNALKYYIKAVDGYKLLSDKYTSNLFRCIWSIGNIYFKKREFGSSQLFLEGVVSIIKSDVKNENYKVITHIYHLLGCVYYEMKNYPDALLNYKKALKVAKQLYPSGHPNIKAIAEEVRNVMDRM